MHYIKENDIVDLSYMQEQVNMLKREELLKKHPYKIWKGSDRNWHTYFPDENEGRVPKKRARLEDLEEDIISFWREQSENPTVEEIFNEWNDRRLSLQKISNATHLRNCQIFNRHFKEFGKLKIRSLEEEEVSEFLEEQIPKFNLTAKAFSNLKTIMRGVLKRAKKRKLISFSVEEILQDLDTSDSEFKKVIKEDYEEVFNEEETPIIIKYLEENMDVMNLGILLMFISGARIGEVVTLKYSDFDENAFRIRRTETRYTDENGDYVYNVKEYPKSAAGIRTVVVPSDYEWVINGIRNRKTNDDYVFTKDGKRITTPAMRMHLKRVCVKLDIYPKSPHKIRKTYGTILMDNNIDNRLIIEQMGHTDIMCSEKHYHRNRKSVQRKEEILSRIPDFSVKK